MLTKDERTDVIFNLSEHVALTTTMPAYGWRRLKNPDRWVGSCAGRRGELCLQPTFRSHSPSPDSMWSISKERVPDLVLTMYDSKGVRFIVLDAK